MKPQTSDDGNDYSGTTSEIRKILFSISMAKAREWLLKQLLSKNLMTRDILSFAMKQSNLRLENKDLDRNTVKVAMRAKLVDVRLNLTRLLLALRQLKETLLDSLGGRTFKLRKIMTKLKTDPLRVWEKKMNQFKSKIEHYERKQKDIILSPQSKTSMRCNDSGVPQRLSAYKDLTIFKDPKAFPKKQKPLGPFICDPRIALSDDEMKILCKQPKFSVMGEVLEADMLLETEKMLGKHRYQDGLSARKKRKADITAADTRQVGPSIGLPARGGELNGPSNGPLTRGGSIEKTDCSVERRHQDLLRIWQENEDRFLYNPLKNKLDFRGFRPTDYTLNKRITLPKPLKVDQELECEIRRRDFMNAFSQYTKTTCKKVNTKDSNSKKDSATNCINLTKAEQRGLRSLKKRIQNGDLCVAQSDKSSRLCVLSRKQYLESGASHTKKDKEISWRDVKQLQTQVNNNVWWAVEILGVSEKRDKARMMNNLMDNGMEIPEMKILLKDHKDWSVSSNKCVPSRPVVSGRTGFNTHLSEVLSQILEPIALEMEGAEISSTEELLERLEDVNNNILNNPDWKTNNCLQKLNDKLIGHKHEEKHEPSPPPETPPDGDRSLTTILEELIYTNEQPNIFQTRDVQEVGETHGASREGNNWNGELCPSDGLMARGGILNKDPSSDPLVRGGENNDPPPPHRED